MPITSVADAMEQLTYPSFFDSSERKAAYSYVMRCGSAEEQLLAEIYKLRYPFEKKDELYSSKYERHQVRTLPIS